MPACSACNKQSPHTKRGLCLKCYGHQYWTSKRYIRNPWRAKLAREIHILLDIPLGCTERIGQKIITAVLDAITAGLLRGESVYIKGFGTFSIHTKPSYKQTNVIIKSGHKPILFTETPIEISARKYVHFRPCEALKAMVTYQSPNKKSRDLIRKWNANADKY